MGLTPEQHAYLLNPLRSSRVATRRQGGKDLSYLEAWDVKAHLIRIFGFCNFDSELLDYGLITTRNYQSSSGDTAMVEVVWHAKVRLTVRDKDGHRLATYTEGAVGSASGPATMLGDQHDNALKTAESDALKRCAINLGTQFGLSLYDNGSKADVVRQVLVAPEGGAPAPEKPAEPLSDEALTNSLGATVVGTEPPVAPPLEDKVEATA